MADKVTVLEYVKTYSDKYRGTGLPPLEISEDYSLFPTEQTSDPKWPQPYPFGKRQGVYLIFDGAMKLLYVGKASVKNTLERRLSAYFSYGIDKICEVKMSETWSKKPAFLITIAVPIDAPFEAPALEEYLIKSFGNELPDNRAGIA